MQWTRLCAIALATALACAPPLDALAKSGGGGGFGGGGGSRSMSSGSSSGFGRTAPSSMPSARPSMPSTPSYGSKPSAAPSAPSYGSKPGVAPSSYGVKPSAPARAAPSAPTPPAAATSYGVKPGIAIGAGIAAGAAVGAAATPASATTSDKPTNGTSYGTKPGAPAASMPISPGTYGAKPGSISAPAAIVATPSKKTAIDQAVERKTSVDAWTTLKASREKEAYKAPPAARESIRSNPIASSYASTNAPRVTVNHYYDNRDRYYRDYGWSRPVYYNYGAPSYGAYDTMFLLWALEHNRAFYYHHAADPGVRAFMHDYQAKADENAELKAQLARVQEETSRMTDAVNAKYLPEGIKPEVALAPEVVTGYVTPKIEFATGVEGSSYASLCNGNDKVGLVGFQANAKQVMDVVCTKTGGSRDNVDLFLTGKVPMIIAQADALDLALAAKAKAGIKATFGTKQLSAFNELIYILVNKESGIKSIADLKPGTHTLYLGPVGSGGAVAYQNMAKHASARSWLILSKRIDQYERIGVDNKTSYKDAIRITSQDPKAATLVMMPGYSHYMMDVEREYGDKVKLVPVNARGFTDARDRDGNVVYHECAVSTEHYPKLLGNSTPKTLCVQAVVVVSEDWVKKNPAGTDALITAWEHTKADVVRLNNGVH